MTLMSVQDSNKKLVIKGNQLPGVDKSVNDLSMMAAVPTRRTKVTKAIHYDTKTRSFLIGLKERLNVLDVIKPQRHKVTYKIVKFAKVTDHAGNLYKIVRTDGKRLTSVDINLSSVGDKVLIPSRRSFKQKFAKFQIYNGY